ncbi:MAG TPA: hypothetical protein VNH64_07895 [Parvularculaceae bacterium]|nr:hypothetical protein [Parvularculaceae bacterium]
MSKARRVDQLRLALALLFGALIVIWLGAGFFASRLSPAFSVDNNDAANRYSTELEARSYANPGGPIAQTPGASDIQLRYFLNRPVYLVSGGERPALFDAATGEKLSPISEQMAREIARLAFVGEGEIESVALLTTPPADYGGRIPIWRATFTDKRRTRLYISPDTGAVVARRNRNWPLYQFVRALHIAGEDDDPAYKDPLLDIIAAIGFLLALAGVWPRLSMPHGLDRLAAGGRQIPGVETDNQDHPSG